MFRLLFAVFLVLASWAPSSAASTCASREANALTDARACIIVTQASCSSRCGDTWWRCVQSCGGAGCFELCAKDNEACKQSCGSTHHRKRRHTSRGDHNGVLTNPT